jgi:hypothetical protein
MKYRTGREGLINWNTAIIYKLLISYDPEVHHIITKFAKIMLCDHILMSENEAQHLIDSVMTTYKNMPTQTDLKFIKHNHADRTSYEYGDFKLDVSTKWWFHDTLNELIMLDLRTTNEICGIHQRSKKTSDIFTMLSKDYSNIIEISAGYDSMLQNIPDYTYFNYIPNTLQAIPEVDNKTIILVNQRLNPLLGPALIHTYKQCLVIQYYTGPLRNGIGWLHIEPYSTTDFMYVPCVEPRPMFHHFEFRGPKNILYKLQKQFMTPV